MSSMKRMKINDMANLYNTTQGEQERWTTQSRRKKILKGKENSKVRWGNGKHMEPVHFKDTWDVSPVLNPTRDQQDWNSVNLGSQANQSVPRFWKSANQGETHSYVPTNEQQPLRWRHPLKLPPECAEPLRGEWPIRWVSPITQQSPGFVFYFSDGMAASSLDTCGKERAVKPRDHVSNTTRTKNKTTRRLWLWNPR